MSTLQKSLLTITEIAMLAYWVLAGLLLAQIIYIRPDLMYSDYQNPLIVSWNWSFMPLDVLFALSGLAARFIPMGPGRKSTLTTVSLALMFCAGLMAISFWAIRSDFDPLWWGANLWLMALSLWVFSSLWRAPG